jgi:cytochrome bd-type quinol oxidase subunit 1
MNVPRGFKLVGGHVTHVDPLAAMFNPAWASAITTAPGLGVTFTAFTLLYIGLTALTVWAVRRLTSGAPETLPAPRLSVA